MEFKKGDKIRFNVYGNTVIGDFVKLEDDKITIKVTQDYVSGKIGRETAIHISHDHFLIN